MLFARLDFSIVERDPERGETIVASRALTLSL